MQEFQLVEYSDQRILTTQQLANGYGATAQKITNNFNNNKKHYEEGKHYYRLEGEEKHNFLNLTKIEFGSKNAKFLYLWTERGALLHAKSLNTDKAWQVYEHLVDTYFRVRSQIHQPQIQTNPEQTLLSQLGRLISLMEQQFQQPAPTNLISTQSEPAKTKHQYLTREELKSYLNISMASVDRLIAREDFTAKIKQPSGSVLIDREVLDDWLTQQTGPLTSRYRTYNMDTLKKKTMLTKDEAAFYIGIHKKTLTNIMNKGDFYPLVRIGHARGRVFVNREKLDQWIYEQDGSRKVILT